MQITVPHSHHLWIMCFILVAAVSSQDKNNNNRVKVDFLQNPKGKWLSFLNFKVTFQNPDIVDVDPPLQMKNMDFDQIEEENFENEDWTIIYITPAPLLDFIEKPTTTIPVTSTTSSQGVTSPGTTEAVVDYPINDHIPGLINLQHFIIPHRLRHDHHHHHNEVEATTTNVNLATTNSAIEASGQPLPVDDEDYQGGTPFSSTAASEIEDPAESSTGSDVDTEAAVESTSTPLSSNEGEIFEEDYEFDFNTTMNSSEALDGLFLGSNETEEELFILTAREVLHTDLLNRNESELRDLLTNLTYLEVEEDFGSYHRDHGGSFLLPILKSVDYDNSSVPIVFSDVPLNVLVKLNIIHLANFDSQQMEYTIDLEMEMRWFDVRLANNYSKPIRVREKQIIDLVFRPDPYFVNSKYSYFHTVSFPNFRMRIMPTGLVIYTMRVTLLPSCSMTFCRFPHDSQQCDLLISSIAYPKSFVNLIWNYDAITFASRVSLPELRIKKLTTEHCQVEGKLISSSCLRLVFALERDGARYIIEKYVPSTLAMMFAWVAPFVPYNYEEVRIVTPITVLLTLVQMEKGDLNVRTSYLTSMDIWFGAMKTFSVLSLVESLIVLALIKRSRAMEKQAHRATNLYAKELFISEKRRLTDLYHRLDAAARYLSPVVFMFFFVYYVLYIAQGDETYCLNRSIL